MTFSKSPPAMCAVFTALLTVSGGKSGMLILFFEAMPSNFLPAANFLVLESTHPKGDPLSSPGPQQLILWCVQGDKAFSVSHPKKQEGQAKAAELACSLKAPRHIPFI